MMASAYGLQTNETKDKEKMCHRSKADLLRPMMPELILALGPPWKSGTLPVFKQGMPVAAHFKDCF